jgi:hypothetical protein
MSKPGQQRCVAGTDEVVIYHGYPVIAASECEGWFFGAISQFLENAPDISGDGFVVAPDGSRADLLWQIGSGECTEILPADSSRWGVYSVWFPKPINSLDDLIFGFRFLLPDLQKLFQLSRPAAGKVS